MNDVSGVPDPIRYHLSVKSSKIARKKWEPKSRKVHRVWMKAPALFKLTWNCVDRHVPSGKKSRSPQVLRLAALRPIHSQKKLHGIIVFQFLQHETLALLTTVPSSDRRMHEMAKSGWLHRQMHLFFANATFHNVNFQKYFVSSFADLLAFCQNRFR